ncbi:hypothetical protein MKW92_018432, partial [Papaver armeniacum]
NWISSEGELKRIKEVVSTFALGNDLTLCCYACSSRCCSTIAGGMKVKADKDGSSPHVSMLATQNVATG